MLKQLLTLFLKPVVTFLLYDAVSIKEGSFAFNIQAVFECLVLIGDRELHGN